MILPPYRIFNRAPHSGFNWSETIQEELSTGWGRVIEHELSGKVTFPVYSNL